MKKTFNINVAGYPFVIDDDAYNLLNDYLDTIEHAFSSYEDSGELISDLESRIAEILLEYTAEGSPIINAQQVEELIARVGKPEDILDDEEKAAFGHDERREWNSERDRDTNSDRITPPPMCRRCIKNFSATPRTRCSEAYAPVSGYISTLMPHG